MSKQDREVANTLASEHGLRLRRARSWVDKAKQCMEADDPDSAFLFYWIAFNALYANEQEVDRDRSRRVIRKQFIKQCHRLEIRQNNKRLYDFAWDHSSLINNLLNNQYLFGPYWEEVTESIKDKTYREKMISQNKAFWRQFRERANANRVYELLFHRLQLLRNQLAHGSATYQGSLNRDQVKSSARFMHEVVPMFLSIFREHPEEDWGRPPYPPQDQ